jgi:aspartate racemase
MKTEDSNRNLLGVLGGLGPLASAEFLKTLYEYSLREWEQETPRIVLYSDPTFPDRTQVLLSGEYEGMLQQLIEALSRLRLFGVSRIVICCVTMHYLLPRLPAELRRQIISLLDVIFANVIESRKKHLLVCTMGTRKLQIFQNHCQWETAQDYFVLPEESDQELIHDLIYRIKKNSDTQSLFPSLRSLLVKYEVNSFIAGCTEIHLLAKQFASPGVNSNGYGCIDPLILIAQEVARQSI